MACTGLSVLDWSARLVQEVRRAEGGDPGTIAPSTHVVSPASAPALNEATAVNARPVTVRVEVAVPPATAFTIFTEDISQWWRRGTPYWNDRERGKAVRFEPRLGGRLIEVWDLATGEGLDRGRITAWEPGRYLRFTWRQPNWPAALETEVEVSFRASRTGTTVELTHHGLDRVPIPKITDQYRTGWTELLRFFTEDIETRRHQ